MFKIPSLQQLLTGFVFVIKRFPLVMGVSLIGTIAFMLLIEVGYDHTNGEWLRELYTRIILTSILGLTFLLSVSLFAEQQQFSNAKSWLLQLGSVAIVTVLYFLLHPIYFTTNAFRFGFLIVAFHLMVSFAPFLNKGSIDGFWEYNKQLFLRILLSALYSTVLFVGLCVAIVSTNLLFSLDLDSEIYGHLAAIVYGLFNTAFFLAGIPSEWKLLEHSHTYPKGLKIFTQFVLIPLATIYLAILLAYELKVIIDWSLPKGLVASLVLGYAVYGILSILLVYPVRNDSQNRWISTFSKLFYLLLIPLIILLVLAVYWRISQYGITESRYILVVLSIWLTGITAYFLIGKKQNIKLIPISLCVVTLLCTWGPQSASSLSVQSQKQQLIELFKKNNAFTNNTFQKLPDSVSAEETDRARDIVYYLTEREGLNPFKPHLSITLDSLENSTVSHYYKRSSRYNEELLKELGITYRYRNYNYYSAYAEKAIISTESYDAFAHLSYYQNSHYITLSFDVASQTLHVRAEAENADFVLTELFDRIKKNNQAQVDKNMNDLFVKAENGRAAYTLMFKNISFHEKDGGNDLQSFEGYLLIDYR